MAGPMGRASNLLPTCRFADPTTPHHKPLKFIKVDIDAMSSSFPIYMGPNGSVEDSFDARPEQKTDLIVLSYSYSCSGNQPCLSSDRLWAHE
jgi:hypothetical protein